MQEANLTVFDIAAFFIHRLGPMSARCLEGLVYYAQAWSIGLNNRPLFPEEIKAWRRGPVVRELYMKHRGMFVSTSREVGSWDPYRLQEDPRVMEILEGVARFYGPSKGAYPTHPDEPYKVAEAHMQASEEPVISTEKMREFYAVRTPPWRN